MTYHDFDDSRTGLGTDRAPLRGRWARYLLATLLLAGACGGQVSSTDEGEPVGGEIIAAEEDVADEGANDDSGGPVDPDVLPAPHLTRYTIDQAAHPAAVCNDGTTPVFYYRPGVGDGADDWFIYFKGGGSCYDGERCRERERNLISSDPWMRESRERMRFDGIFNPNSDVNPDFYDWNHVYMVYCSSDQWSGTRPASRESGNWHFAGHHIVNAIIDALQDPDIIGDQTLSDATHVLFGGSSAGSGGLRYNIDRLAERLDWADVRAVSDAGLAPAVDPAFEERELEIAQLRYDLWQPVLEESCVEAHPEDSAAQCSRGTDLVANGHLGTPMFMHMDQLDPLPLEAQGLDRRDSEDYELIDEFGAQIRDLLDDQEGVFSPRLGRHIILGNRRFYTYAIEGHTMVEVLGNWYFGRGEPTNVIEQP